MFAARMETAETVNTGLFRGYSQTELGQSFG